MHQVNTAESSSGTAELHSIVHDCTAAAAAAAAAARSGSSDAPPVHQLEVGRSSAAAISLAAAVPAVKATVAVAPLTIAKEKLAAFRAQLATEPPRSPFAKYASTKHQQQQQAFLSRTAIANTAPSLLMMLLLLQMLSAVQSFM
jgi:hypothetical protein